MITLSDFKDWLKKKLRMRYVNWFTGGLRDSREKAIVIYNGNAFINPMAIGGLKNSSYRGKGIRILVHWNKNAKDSELRAQKVYKAIHGLTNETIANKRVVQFNMRDPEPIFLGVDESGIYEYVIDLEMIIERW